MKRVTGIGGIFFKSRDPKELKQWYQQHLGIMSDEYGATFSWRDENEPEQIGSTVWAPFPHDSKYFDPCTAPFMINYRVADLDGLLAALREEGVTAEDRIEITITVASRGSMTRKEIESSCGSHLEHIRIIRIRIRTDRRFVCAHLPYDEYPQQHRLGCFVRSRSSRLHFLHGGRLQSLPIGSAESCSKIFPPILKHIPTCMVVVGNGDCNSMC